MGHGGRASSTDRAAQGTAAKGDSSPAGSESLNEVRLRGRVSAAGAERVLPSGDALVTGRLVVRRAAGAASRRQHVDTLDCVAWTPRARRSLLSWEPGNLVEVEGAIRRRFWRGAGGLSSRVEVEVSTARKLRRPPIAGRPSR
ncbi:hypothetical protein BH20ACT6_BH20ACT6_12960 [soil metagenome]